MGLFVSGSYFDASAGGGELSLVDSEGNAVEIRANEYLVLRSVHVQSSGGTGTYSLFFDDPGASTPAPGVVVLDGDAAKSQGVALAGLEFVGPEGKVPYVAGESGSPVFAQVSGALEVAE